MKENLLAFRWNPITMDRQNIKIRGIGRPRCAGLRRLQMRPADVPAPARPVVGHILP